MIASEYPAGPYQLEHARDAERRAGLIAAIKAAAAALRGALAGLSEDHLDTRYRNWAIWQIVHHLADSHVNSYARFKSTLTEERPTIKAYDEGRWAVLADSRDGDIRAPVALLEGLHVGWVQLMRSMSDEELVRSFVHPESGDIITLAAALG